MERLGCVKSNPEVKRNLSIDKLLNAEGKRFNKSLSILIAGPASSGKTTVLKQMMLFNGVKFSRMVQNINTVQIRLASLDFIISDIVYIRERHMHLLDAESASFASQCIEICQYWHSRKEEIKNLALQISGNEDVKFELPSDPLLFQFIQARDFLLRVAQEKPDIYATFPSQTNFNFFEFINYFRPILQDTLKSRYIPTADHILNTRIITRYPSETSIILRKTLFRFIDVQGQKSKRSKWMKFFNDIDGIIFVAAISTYDQQSPDVPEINNIVETLSVFENLCQQPLLQSLNFILFLNKMDLFKKKISDIPISIYFPEFEGNATDSKESRRFIQRKFERVFKESTASKRPSVKRRVYVQCTHANDQTAMKPVIAAVQEQLLHGNLEAAGMVIRE